MSKHKQTKFAVPIEVVTVTVQRSLRYVETDDVNLALASIKQHVNAHPECYDDIDDVIAYTHEVRLPGDHPIVTEIEADIVLDTPEDLCYPLNPDDVLCAQYR